MVGEGGEICFSLPPPAQCSKLLIDTKVIQFYPSKFVLITDILDNFGQFY